MGLHFVLGRAGSGKSEYCLREAQSLLSEAGVGASVLLLVPEQATFQAERALVAGTSAQAVIRAHGLGFRRLAELVLAETGGASQPQLSELGKTLVLKRILLAQRENLHILGRAATQRSFASSLSQSIRELKTWCVTPRQLEAATQSLAAGPLTEKLHDLSLLYREFEDFLAERYFDPQDALTLLVNRLRQSELTRQATVFIDGFHFFTPQEYAIVAGLLQCADQVYVTLCLEEPEAVQHKHENSLFHRQWQIWCELKKRAGELGIPVQETQLAAGRRFAVPELAFIEQEWARPSTAVFAEASKHLEVAEAANRRAEAEGLARRLIQLVRDRQWRWRDMAILLPVPERGELLEAVLEDYGIPYFSDRRRPAVHHPLSEFLRSAVEVVVGNWPYEAVFRCLKTDLFPLKRRQVDQLENYCLAFGIQGWHWSQESDWRYMRRLSLTEEGEETGQEELAEINRIRRTVWEKMQPFQQALQAGGCVQDYAAAVYQLLLDMDISGQLERWSNMDQEAGFLTQSREHGQLWEQVVHLLDELVGTCGQEQITAADFGELLAEGLEGLSLGLIPPGLDYVTLSTLDRVRSLQVRAVFIPGVEDGALPRRAREEGLLTDAERLLLADQDIMLPSGSGQLAFQEQFTVYSALSRAGEYLWLSCALADEEGRELVPSLLLQHLQEKGVGGRRRLLAMQAVPGEEQDWLVRPDRALPALSAGLQAELATGGMESPWWQVYNWLQSQKEQQEGLRRMVKGLFYANIPRQLPRDLAKKLYLRHGNLRGSVTRFESYHACPFQYYLRYGLGLKERERYDLAAPDFGQFLHAVLRSFGEEIASEGRSWAQVEAAEVTQRCQRIVEELAPKLQNEILLSSGHYRHIKSRLANTASRALLRLTAFAMASRFQTVALEQSFGQGEGAWPALKFDLSDGSRVELVGQIDRLDAWRSQEQDYLLVVDYKSGQAKLTLNEVFYGLRLQLLTYLLAACQAAPELHMAEALPAGGLYFYLKDPRIIGEQPLSDTEIAAEIGKKLRLRGWLLENPEVIQGVDQTAAAGSEFVAIRLRAAEEGYTVHGSDKGSVKSLEELALLMELVKEKIVTGAEALLAGRLDLAPYRFQKSTPCTFCAYSAVCQFDPRQPDNRYRELPVRKDEEIWRDLEQGKGDLA